MKDIAKLKNKDRLLYELYNVAKRSMLTKKSTLREIETSVTSDLVKEMQNRKPYALYQNEMRYDEINPSYESEEKMDISSFTGGGFHFIEYKHYDVPRKKSDSNWAVLRSCLNDIRKLKGLKKCKASRYDSKKQRYTFCCYINIKETIVRSKDHEEIRVRTDKLIKIWKKNPEWNNTSNKSGKSNNLISVINALSCNLNRKKNYVKSSIIYGENEHYFLVVEI